MAIFIFLKKSNNVLGSVYRIASDQAAYDANKSWTDDLYDIVTVPYNDFLDLRLGRKVVLSKNENTITYADSSCGYSDSKELASTIKSMIDNIDAWLENNSSKPLASTVTTYKNYIKSIDVNSITYPFENSVEFYAQSQGITPIHFLELL